MKQLRFNGECLNWHMYFDAKMAERRQTERGTSRAHSVHYWRCSRAQTCFRNLQMRLAHAHSKSILRMQTSKTVSESHALDEIDKITYSVWRISGMERLIVGQPFFLTNHRNHSDAPMLSPFGGSFSAASRINTDLCK